MRYPLPQNVPQSPVGLAEIAEAVVLTSPDNPVIRDGLVITRLPGTHGIRIALAPSREVVLHVDSQGQVYTYKPRRSDWCQRLRAFVEHPHLPPSQVQVTVEVPTQVLRDAAVHAKETPQSTDPVNLMGLAVVKAAMALRYPLMP